MFSLAPTLRLVQLNHARGKWPWLNSAKEHQPPTKERWKVQPFHKPYKPRCKYSYTHVYVYPKYIYLQNDSHVSNMEGLH